MLIERTIGAGHMLVLTAPIEREWNDLAIHPLFVQLHRRGRALPGARRRFRRQHDRRLGRLDRIDRGRRRADIRSAGPSACSAWRRRAAADRLIPDADRVLRDPRQRRRALGRRERRRARVGSDAAARDVRAALARDAGAQGRAEASQPRRRRRPTRSRVRSDPQCFGSPQRCCWRSCCWRIATSRSAGRRRNERSRATRNVIWTRCARACA